MAKFIRRRGRKYSKKPRRKVYRKRSTKPRFPDALNVRLQHNTISVSNIGTVPTALGSGCTTYAIPGAVINNVAFNDVTGAFLFRLRDSLQWNQFATLYDRCKLLGAKVTFIPQWSMGFAATTNVTAQPGNLYSQTALIPTMKIVRDYDDSTPPPTINSVWARRGRIFRLNKPFSVYVKPRMRTGVWSVPQGGGTASLIPGASMRASDLDVATAADVGLFGLKFGIKDWNGNADMYLKIEIEYHVSFKNMLYNGAPPKGETVSEEHDMIAEEGLPCEDEVVTLKV